MAQFRSCVPILASLAAAVVTMACSQPDQPSVVAPKTFLPLPPVHLAVVDTPYFMGSREAAAAVRAAEERVWWVSRLHSMAIREAIAERKTWTKQQRKDGALVCEQAKRLGLKYLPQARRAIGSSADVRTDLQLAYAAVHHVPRCRQFLSSLFPSSMNVFAPRGYLESASVAPAPYSAELDTYMDAMQAANEGAGNSGYSLVTSLNAVANQAYSVLSQAEFDVLVAHADLSISSSIEWHAVSVGGGWEEGCTVSCEEPMSIFTSSRVLPQVDFIYWAYEAYLTFAFSERARGVAKWDAAGFVGGWRFGGWGGAFAAAAASSIAAF